MYSYIFGAAIAVGTFILAQFIDGRLAVLIGLLVFALRWWQVGARAKYYQRTLGITPAQLNAIDEARRKACGASQPGSDGWVKCSLPKRHAGPHSYPAKSEPPAR